MADKRKYYGRHLAGLGVDEAGQMLAASVAKPASGAAPGTLDQHVRAFLTERRLTIEETEAVMKSVKGDPALGNLSWSTTTSELNPAEVYEAIAGARRKVLAWMDKYRSNHPARALFTGES